MTSSHSPWLRVAGALALAVLSCAPGVAGAVFPEKPVRIVVAFAPGGATDVVARALGVRLSQGWRQQVIIENRPGAGGNIGADTVAKAPADGYTLLMASPAEVAINPFLYSQMSFDPAKDLVAVAKVASAPLVLVVHPDVPASNLAELIAYLKTKQDGVTYASSGTGGPQHLAGEQFRVMTNTRLIHVPYKGGAPAITDLLGGQVQMFFAGLPPARPHIQAGKLRAIAVTSAKESPLMPGVPPIDASLPGFAIENWQGIFAPAGTPESVVAQIARDIGVIGRDKAFDEQLFAQGAGSAPMSPAEFAAFVQGERDKYARLVKASGAKVD